MAQHTLDVTAFRAMFPEFADTVKYPDASITMWRTMGNQYIYSYDNCLISGDVLQLALNLVTAHLAKSFTMISNGQSVVVVAGATEGSVAVSMVPPPAKTGWQWWLNTTPYGVQLWALLQTLVVGGFTIGGAPESSGFRRVYGVFM